MGPVMGKARSVVHDSLSHWLGFAATDLGRAGLPTPMHDAERLAAHALGLSWSDLKLRDPDKRLDGVTLRKLDAMLARRKNGEPLAYIEGSRGFYGLELACGPGVLVPRPETEVLVDVALEVLDGDAPPIVVDIGTGTGAIAIAIAVRRPDAEVIAVDISDVALGYARRNATSYDVDVWFARGDLFDGVRRDLVGRVDLVVSNPPYIPEGTPLPADVMAEPHEALFAGRTGDDMLRRLIDEAPMWLRSGGTLALEIGQERQSALLAGARVRSDSTGRPRVVWASS